MYLPQHFVWQKHASFFAVDSLKISTRKVLYLSATFLFSLALYVLYLGWRMGSETQLWDETQQSAKLGLTFFQIISLSLAYSRYTSLCCSFYLVLNKTLKVFRLNGTCCARRSVRFFTETFQGIKWTTTLRHNWTTRILGKLFKISVSKNEF